LTGVFVSAALGGVGLAEGVSMGKQVWVQFIAVAATIVYDAVLTFIILKLVGAFIGLRVSEDEETQGLDISLHDERGYDI
jgi:Amt family ammonium transporter